MPIDRVVAVVNQSAITERELGERIRLAERQLDEQQRPRPSSDALQRQVLEAMVLQNAQMQYARNSGIAPTDADVDNAIADIAQRNGVAIEELRRKLSERGIPFETYRKQLMSEIVTMRLREREASAKVNVTEAEVDAFLKKNGQQTGMQAPEYSVRQILIKLPSGADAAAIEQARARAEQLSRQLQGGADFAALAREHSDGPEATQGGDMGWRSSDRLPQLFVDAVAPLNEGQVAPIVRSPAGFHLLKLDGKRAGGADEASMTTTHVRHILLPVTGGASEQENTRRLAEFRRRIQNGEASFESLARQFSSDGSAAQGGDLGWVYSGDLVPPFERAMNALGINELSAPVRSQFGLHLIQVLERKVDQKSPERMRAAARNALKEQKTDESFDEWLRELRDRTYVEYRLEQV